MNGASSEPVVVSMRLQFQSVASPPKRDGLLLSKVTRVPLRAPFGSIFFRIGAGCTSGGYCWQRVVRYSRCTFFSDALAQARKEAGRGFSKAFNVVGAHIRTKHQPS